MKKALHRNGLVAQFAYAVQIVVMLFYPALALADDPQVTAGDATVSHPDANTTVIDQSSQKAVYDYNGLRIELEELLRIQTPGADAASLLRDSGANPSSILGQLISNGKVFIVNPNGVVFGRDAKVDVAGMLATTFNIGNDAFMNGNLAFAQDPTAQLSAIINQGEIRVSENGFVFLVAPAVSNEGLIIANLGQVVLGAGKSLTLDFNGDGLVTYQIDGKVLDSVVSPDGTTMREAVANKGTIQANGGTVVLHANAAGSVFDSLVNNSGVIEAKSMETRGGVVRLEGNSSADFNGIGAENNFGQVQATDGVVLNSGDIDVSAIEAGVQGGTVVLSGAYVGVSGSIDAQGGGNVLVTSSMQTVVASTASINVSGVGNGDAGSAVVWSDTYTRFFGSILGRGGDAGGDGGSVEVSGHSLVNRGTVDLRAPGGTMGTLLLDPIATFVRGTLVVPVDGDDTGGDVSGSTFTGASAPGIMTFAELPAGAEPYDIFESEIEAQSALSNITIRSTQFFSTEDDLLFAGTTVLLAVNSNLTIEVDGTGPAAGSITLDVPFLTQGTGSITVNGSTVGSFATDVTLNVGSGFLALGTGSVTIDTNLGNVLVNGLISTASNGSTITVRADVGTVTAGATGTLAAGGLGTTTGALVMTASGLVSDVAGSVIASTGQATITSTAGNIVLNDSENFGSLNFSGVDVTISENDGVNLTGGNNAFNNLSLTSEGDSIIDAAVTSLTVAGNSVINANAGSITLGDSAGDAYNFNGANAQFSASANVTLGSTGAGVDSTATMNFTTLSFNGVAVEIFEDSPTALADATAGVSTLPALNASTSLLLVSTGAITDVAGTDVSVGSNSVIRSTGVGTAIVLGNSATDTYSIAQNATFQTNGGNISVGSDGTGTFTDIGSTVTLTTLSFDTGATGGNVEMFIDSSVILADSDGATTPVALLHAQGTLYLDVVPAAGTITDAVNTDMTVTGNAVFVADGGITLANAATDSYVFSAHAGFNSSATPNNIFVGSSGGAADSLATFTSASLSFTGFNVEIFQDAATVLSDSSTAGTPAPFAPATITATGTLLLSSTGSVTDNAGTNVAVTLAGQIISTTVGPPGSGSFITLGNSAGDSYVFTNQATFTANAATGDILVGVTGVAAPLTESGALVTFGSLLFNSGRDVRILEDNPMGLVDTSTAVTAALGTTGAGNDITDFIVGTGINVTATSVFFGASGGVGTGDSIEVMATNLEASAAAGLIDITDGDGAFPAVLAGEIQLNSWFTGDNVSLNATGDITIAAATDNSFMTVRRDILGGANIFLGVLVGSAGSGDNDIYFGDGVEPFPIMVQTDGYAPVRVLTGGAAFALIVQAEDDIIVNQDARLGIDQIANGNHPGIMIADFGGVDGIGAIFVVSDPTGLNTSSPLTGNLGPISTFVDPDILQFAGADLHINDPVIATVDITATARRIFFEQPDGFIRTTGTLTLTATGAAGFEGTILDYTNFPGAPRATDPELELIAPTIVLNASGGTGLFADPLAIDLDVSTGDLTAVIAPNAFQDGSGNMNINDRYAGTNWDITADALPGLTVRRLDTFNGSIFLDTMDNDLGVDGLDAHMVVLAPTFFAPTNGVIAGSGAIAVGNGNVTLRTIDSGNIQLGTAPGGFRALDVADVTAFGDSVILDAIAESVAATRTRGSITDVDTMGFDNANNRQNVRSTTLTVLAFNAVGTGFDTAGLNLGNSVLEVDLFNLAATSDIREPFAGQLSGRFGAGGFFLENFGTSGLVVALFNGTLGVNQRAAGVGGAVHIVNNDAQYIQAADLTSAGAIVLENLESAALDTDDDLVIDTDVEVVSTGAAVLLRAGDSIRLNAGAGAAGATTTSLVAGFGDNDVQGNGIVVTSGANPTFIGSDDGVGSGTAVVTTSLTVSMTAPDSITFTDAALTVANVTSTGVTTITAGTDGSGSLQLSSVTAGSLNARAAGTITDLTAGASAIAVAGLATFQATDTFGTTFAVTLGDAAGETVDFGSLNVTGANVAITEDSAMVIAGLTATGTLALTAVGAAPITTITQTGAINVTGATTLTAVGDDITLNNIGNSFGGTVTVTDGANVSLNDTNALDLGATTTALTSLTVQANGNITQSGALSVTGASSFNAGAFDVTLALANTFGSVGVTGRNASLTTGAGDADGVVLNASTLSGNLTVTTGGVAGMSITQAGVLSVAGTTTLTAGAGDITLSTSANFFNSVTVVSGFTVGLSDANAIDLGASTVGNTLTVFSNGNITDSGALVVTGAASFSAGGTGDVLLDGLNDFSSVSVVTSRGIVLNDINALTLTTATASTGDVRVTTTGNLTVGTIAANGAGSLVSLNSGAAILDDADGNDVTASRFVAIAGAGIGTADPLETTVRFFEGTAAAGGIDIANTGVMTVGGIGAVASVTATGAITITTTSPLTVAANMTSAATIVLAAGETADPGVFADDLTINTGVTVTSTFAGLGVLLSAGDDVIIGGTVNATGAGGIVTLDANVTDLDGGGSVVDANGSLVDVTATTLFVFATGVTAGNAIDIDTNVTTLASATVAGVGGINVNDTAGGLAVSIATTTAGDMSFNATGGALDLGAVTTAGNLTATAGGVITDSAAIAVTGLGSFNANNGASDITFDFGATTFGSFGATGAIVTLSETDATVLANVTATTLNVTSTGTITQTVGSSVLVTGATGLTAGANDITLANATNDFGGAVVLTTTGNVSLRDRSAIDLGATGAALATLTVTSAGDITQSGVLSVAGVVNLNSGAFDTTLANAGNLFGGVVNVSNSRNASIADADALSLGVVVSTLSITGAANTNITIDNLTAGTTIALTADLDANGSGAITETGSDPGNDLTAMSATLSSATGIGAAGQLEVHLDQVSATVTGTGAISLSDDASGLDVLTATTATGGNVTLTAAGGDLTLRDVRADVAASTANVIASTTLSGDIIAFDVRGSDVNFNSAGAITNSDPGVFSDVTATTLTAIAANGINLDTTLGTLTLASVTGVGNISIADDTANLAVTAATTNNGNIFLSADAGDLDVSVVTAGGSGSTATLNALLDINDGNAGVNNVTASRFVALSGTGVGDGNAIESNVRFFEALGGAGGIELANTGTLTVGGIGAVTSVTAGLGITISAASPYTQAINMTAGGAIALTAGESAALGDNLTLNLGVVVQSTASTVSLTAGDDVVFGGVIVAAGAATVTAGTGAADGGSVVDGNGTLTDVTAASLTVLAVGGTAANGIDLDTAIATLTDADVTGTGGIDISNLGVGLSTGALITTANGSIRINSTGGTLTLGAGITAGGTGANVNLSTTGAGDIAFGAGFTVTALLDTVTLNAFGSVTDGADATSNVTADSLVATAGTGIGGATPFETTVTNLTALVTGAGLINVSDLAGGLNVLSAVTQGVGTITLAADGGNLALGTVTANAGASAVSLTTTTAGAITDLNGGNTNVTASTLTMAAIAGIDVDTTVATVTSATTTGAAANIVIDEADDVTLTLVTTTTGNITVTAGGSMTLANDDTAVGGFDGGVHAGGAASSVFLSAGGAILDSADAGTDVRNITATRLTAIAGAGVGAGGNGLETAITGALANGSGLLAGSGGTGGFALANTGGLAITTIGTVSGVTADSGDIAISTASPLAVLAVLAAVFTADNVTLTAGEGGDNANLDELTIGEDRNQNGLLDALEDLDADGVLDNAPVSGHNVALNAGDDVIINDTVLAQENLTIRAGDGVEVNDFIFAGQTVSITAGDNGVGGVGTDDTAAACLNDLVFGGGGGIFANDIVIVVAADISLGILKAVNRVSVTSTGGSIFLGDAALAPDLQGLIIAGTSVTLTAANDIAFRVGITGEDLDGDGVLDAGEDLNGNGFLDIDPVAMIRAGTLVTLAAGTDTTGGITDATVTNDIVAQSVTATVGTVAGGITFDAQIETLINASGTGAVNAPGAIDISDSGDNLTVGTILSASTVTLDASGAIIDNNANGTLNVRGTTLTLSTGAGADLDTSIGTLTNDGVATVSGNGDLSIRNASGAALAVTVANILGTGNVSISNNANMAVTTATAANGGVRLTTTGAGSDITAATTVTAGNGSAILTAADDLTSGAVSATNGNATLAAGTGAIIAATTTTTNGDVRMTAGTTVAATTTTTTNGDAIFSGTALTLTAVTTGGAGVGDGSIIGTASAGGISIGLLTADGDSVSLTATGGAINEIADDGAADVVADSALLSGTAGVGTAFAPLEVNVAILAGRFSTGGFRVTDTAGGLTVGTVSGVAGVVDGADDAAAADDVITIVAASPLTVAADILGFGTITLTATEDAVLPFDPNDDLTINADATVSTLADVILTAGDNVIIAGFVNAGASSSITAGAGDNDLLGSAVNMEDGQTHVTLTAGTLTVLAVGNNGNMGINLDTNVLDANLDVTGLVTGGINFNNMRTTTLGTATTVDADTAATTGDGSIALSNSGSAMTVTTPTTVATTGNGDITVTENGGALTVNTLSASAATLTTGTADVLISGEGGATSVTVSATAGGAATTTGSATMTIESTGGVSVAAATTTTDSGDASMSIDSTGGTTIVTAATTNVTSGDGSMEIHGAGGLTTIVSATTNATTTGDASMLVDAETGLTVAGGTGLTTNATSGDGSLTVDVAGGATAINAATSNVTSGEGTIDINGVGGAVTVTTATATATLASGNADILISATSGDLTTTTILALGDDSDVTMTTIGGGDINFNAVTAAGDRVTLDSTGAANESGAGDVAIDITSRELVTVTDAGFGVTNGGVETEVVAVEGDGGTGVFTMTNSGPLTIGIGTNSAVQGVSADGTITITTILIAGQATVDANLAIDVTENVAARLAASDVNLTASELAGGAGNLDDIDVDPLRTVTAGDDIAFSAGDDLTLAGLLIAGDNVNLTAGASAPADGIVDADGGGSIIDLNDTLENVIATTMTARAVGGATVPANGLGISLDTRITTLTAATVGDDSIGTIETGGIRIEDTQFGLTVNSATTEFGSITLSATGGNLAIAGTGVTASTAGGVGNIVLNTFTGMGATGSATSGNVVLGVGAGGADVTAAGDLVEINSVGNVSDGEADGNFDGFPAAITTQNNITSASLLVRARNGFGTAAERIETTVDTVAGNFDQVGFFMTDVAGGLTIGFVTSVDGSVVAGVQETNLTNDDGALAAITIQALSPLTVAADVLVTGAILLIADETADAPVGADDLTVLTGVTIRSTLSSVELTAGDDVSTAVGSFVTAFTTLTIRAGFDSDEGDLDGIGAASLLGTHTSTTSSTLVTALQNITLGVFLAHDGLTLFTEFGNILDGNGPALNVQANGLSTFTAVRGVIGLDTDAIEVEIQNGQLVANAGASSDRVSVSINGDIEPDGRFFSSVTAPGLELFNNTVLGGDGVDEVTDRFFKYTYDRQIRLAGELDHAQPGSCTFLMMYIGDDVVNPEVLYQWDASVEGPVGGGN